MLVLTASQIKLLRKPTFLVAIGVLVLTVFAAIFGPGFLPIHFSQPSVEKGLQFLPPFTQGHILGTDLNGRDLLYRIFIGARVSLLIGLSGAMLSLGVGVGYGLLAGYLGGRYDLVMMRIVEIINAVPRLILVVVLVSIVEGPFRHFLTDQMHDYSSFIGMLGHRWPVLKDLPIYAKTLVLILSLGLIEWLTMARIVRGQVLVLKNLPFILASRSLGQSHFKILLRHILPNLAGIIIIYLTLTIPAVILDESFLSYLGLGVDPSQASWGTLLSDGANIINPIKSYWWLLVFPALFLSITLLSFNFLGDFFRDLLDPRS